MNALDPGAPGLRFAQDWRFGIEEGDGGQNEGRQRKDEVKLNLCYVCLLDVKDLQQPVAHLFSMARKQRP